jgi:hypothetical protein
MTTALEGAEGPASRPGRFLPPRKTPVPMVQEAGWAPGPVWTGAENLAPPPPGFDPRTVQPVASRYTDYATRPTHGIYRRIKGSVCVTAAVLGKTIKRITLRIRLGNYHKRTQYITTENKASNVFFVLYRLNSTSS